MANIEVPDKETIYYIALLVNKGWRCNFSGHWIHPNGKRKRREVRQSCNCCYKEYEYEEWTLDEAIEEDGYD